MPLWFLKLVASSLVVGATSLAGAAVAKSYRDRPRQLRELQSLLQSLLTEIVYGATQLPEAFARLAQVAQPPLAVFFGTVASDLARPGTTAQQAWSDGLNQLQRNTALGQADLAILGQLGSQLGISDRQDQERHLTLVVQQLQREEVRARELCQSNEKMWRYLGVLSGVMVVIVLV